MKLSNAVKEFLEFMDQRGTFTESRSVEEVRKAFTEAQDLPAVDFSGIVETQKSISLDGLDILLNIVRPVGTSGSLPVFPFIYGGGWVVGGGVWVCSVLRHHESASAGNNECEHCDLSGFQLSADDGLSKDQGPVG